MRVHSQESRQSSSAAQKTGNDRPHPKAFMVEAGENLYNLAKEVNRIGLDAYLRQAGRNR